MGFEPTTPGAFMDVSWMRLSLLFCIDSNAADEVLPCIRVEVCEGGKLVAFVPIRHEVLADCVVGGGGVTRIASSP